MRGFHCQSQWRASSRVCQPTFLERSEAVRPTWGVQDKDSNFGSICSLNLSFAVQVTQPQILGIRTSLEVVLLTILGDEKEFYLPLHVFLKGHVFVFKRLDLI